LIELNKLFIVIIFINPREIKPAIKKFIWNFFTSPNKPQEENIISNSKKTAHE